MDQLFPKTKSDHRKSVPLNQQRQESLILISKSLKLMERHLQRAIQSRNIIVRPALTFMTLFSLFQESMVLIHSRAEKTFVKGQPRYATVCSLYHRTAICLHLGGLGMGAKKGIAFPGQVNVTKSEQLCSL